MTRSRVASAPRRWLSLRRWAPAGLFVTSFALTGCFTLARTAPPVRYYALSGDGSGGGAVSSGSPDTLVASGRQLQRPGAAGFTLGVRRITLAAHLAGPRVIVRRGDTEVVMSEFHRWGGDLQDGLTQAFATHLAQAPVLAVDVAPWAVGAAHRYVLQLQVRRFEGVVDSAGTQGWVHLQASWDIVRPRDGRVLMRGASSDRRRPWRVGDYADLVSGLDAALDGMAGDIRRCLSAFPNDSTPPPSCGPAGGAREP